jgi:hypothetical protein
MTHERKSGYFRFLAGICDGCGTWSLTLNEEHRLRVFMTRVLRGIFESKREGSGGKLEKTA